MICKAIKGHKEEIVGTPELIFEQNRCVLQTPNQSLSYVSTVLQLGLITVIIRDSLVTVVLLSFIGGCGIHF